MVMKNPIHKMSLKENQWDVLCTIWNSFEIKRKVGLSPFSTITCDLMFCRDRKKNDIDKDVLVLLVHARER